LAETAGVLAVAKSYTGFGMEHILLGADHLLFVLALLLLVRGGWLLVKTVTAFTVAHSITLAAATLGIIQLPSAPVEAVIALSILFLATELARRHFDASRAQTLTERYPWSVAFVFGLLHGFGFAGALSEVGLPQHAIPLALLFFNVGVELGQLAFVGVALSLASIVRHWHFWNIPVGAWSRLGPVYAIGCIAAFWFIERLNGFL
jgi:hydrogenase/urease accessory protein HupE